MKKLIVFLGLIFLTLRVAASDYIESYNVITDQYSEVLQDIQIVRNINGGTIIIPSFDNSCPEEMKGPFAYACKIVEEYLPPCLPLRVHVTCGRVNSASGIAMSKVRAFGRENFGKNYLCTSLMSGIKGVVLAELARGVSVTYLDSIPNIDFLVGSPDIEITYNSQKLDEFSYSLESDVCQNYDFVSLAIRDLLIGLGLSSSYRYNPITKELSNPTHGMTPFEQFVDKVLGNYGDNSTRFIEATKGELALTFDLNHSLKLYAPSQWQNGVSLNYFIPQADNSISNILAYNWGRGSVTRSLNDDYSGLVFGDLLGWKANFSVGTNSPTPVVGGSTSVLMPYQGSIEISYASYGYKSSLKQSNPVEYSRSSNEAKNEVYEYVNSFHPMQYGSPYYGGEATSISVLRKDGSWDLVKFYNNYFRDAPLSLTMSDLEFHCPMDDYARSPDGYLKARMTVKARNNGEGYDLMSTFFVIDYLPQKVTLNYSITTPQSTIIRAGNTQNVRLFFTGLEGVNKLVIEKHRQGARVPTKIIVTDFKCGYYDTTIDRVTTFTAVAYNDNGATKGVPVTVAPISPPALDIDFTYNTNSIKLQSKCSLNLDFKYKISSVDNCEFDVMYGETTGIVDVSNLKSGIYILSIFDSDFNSLKEFKFKK